MGEQEVPWLDLGIVGLAPGLIGALSDLRGPLPPRNSSVFTGSYSRVKHAEYSS